LATRSFEAEGFRTTVAPEVLADLDREGHLGLLRQLKEEVRAEGGGLAGQTHVAPPRLPRRREPAFLVVLLVAGKEGLRHHAEETACLQHRGRVEQAAALEHRQPHHHDHRAPGGVAQDPLEGALGAADQGGQAEEEVAAGIAGQPQLGEDDDLYSLVCRAGHEVERGVGVPFRVTHRNGRARRRHTKEAERRGAHGGILARPGSGGATR
jgi:hypothetical protein